MTLDLSKQSLNDCQRHQRWNTETYAVFKYSRTEYCIPRMNNLSCTLVKGHTAFHYLLCFWDFEVDSCHWNSWNVWKIEILYFPMCYRNVFQPAGRVHHIEESCVFVSLLCTASHPSHRGAGPLLRRLEASSLYHFKAAASIWTLPVSSCSPLPRNATHQ